MVHYIPSTSYSHTSTTAHHHCLAGLAERGKRWDIDPRAGLAAASLCAFDRSTTLPGAMSQCVCAVTQFTRWRSTKLLSRRLRSQIACDKYSVDTADFFFFYKLRNEPFWGLRPLRIYRYTCVQYAFYTLHNENVSLDFLRE